eukprot:gnl/MRDRNA2_/MRDRNA2_62480_c0_seq1.p1 gnl/MRDRNA2_/MRDRNA2_62480_c0~~gnl/MRDRNA2_/MRDRNA2_62480_c0_seq1.p1  ORF type:complete len:496 (+),score=82.97 gnl/MRDRNA2_/MRDRNA2_62480_c0_seq1:92-1579(+)
MVSRPSPSDPPETSNKRRCVSSNGSCVPSTSICCAKPAEQTLLAALKEASEGIEGLRSMLNQCCDRMDFCEPHIRALLPEPQRRERILAAAEEIVTRKGELPLRGLLLGVKDIITAEGFITRCGSAMPAEEAHDLPPEAAVVRKLRDAGMIVGGKCVTTEFASADPGPTANPWNPAHTPGGSSSGSAAAVAAGEVHVALGTQTVGSVARPGTFCGICAFKPTFGRILTEGVAILAPSADTVGLYTDSVAGMKLVAPVAVEDWNPAKAVGLKKLPVLGVPHGAYLKTFSKKSLDAFEETLSDLQQAGVHIIRVQGVMEDDQNIRTRHLAMINYEWAHSLKPQFDKYASLFRSKTAMNVVRGLNRTAESVKEGREGRLLLRTQLEKAMDAAEIDLWVMPGSIQTPAPKGLDSTGEYNAQLPWTHSGLPTLSLKAGMVDAKHADVSPIGKMTLDDGSPSPLPFGLQLAARFGADEALLHWSVQLEELGIADKQRLKDV